ncbi:MAG: sulfotransferase domain-containing protein [Planctomycetota bacterium]|jgi:hypothetical protein
MSAKVWMCGASSRLTKIIGAHWGERFPFYYVVEYPKSGGSWLADMIADYLQIPRPQHYIFPLGFPCVVHSHWHCDPRLKRVFYLHRDGRDAVVSMYFRVIRLLDHTPDQGLRRYVRKRLKSLFAPGVDRTDIRSVLPGFIDDWAKNPVSTRTSWAGHIREWAFGLPNVVRLSYEELLNDCAGTLSRVLPQHTNEEVDPERIAWTVEKFSFARQTGRKAGTEDRTSFKRKGVAGDWRNHFTRKAGEVFDQHCGDELVQLGYEKDRDWFRSLPD